jgi:hypothetical protein
MRFPHRHTRPLPELTRVLHVNTTRVAHSFIHVEGWLAAATMICNFTGCDLVEI